jgi:hypothetical protein
MGYWKVNERRIDGVSHWTTVEEVQAALPKDVEGLTVDEALRYPCVNFPKGTSTETMQKVKRHLESQGFEPY